MAYPSEAKFVSRDNPVTHVRTLPASQVAVDRPENFGPGSFVFGPYLEHTAERLQMGVRVGDGRRVLALTPWFGGHRQAGSVIEPLEDRNIFGLKATATSRPILDFDPAALTQEAPDSFRGALGLLGFGPTGLTLYAKADDRSGFPTSVGVLIDPITWDVVAREPGQFPTSWTSAWSIRFPLAGNDWFQVAPDRLASGS
jgi:hypothetical protein